MAPNNGVWGITPATCAYVGSTLTLFACLRTICYSVLEGAGAPVTHELAIAKICRAFSTSAIFHAALTLARKEEMIFTCAGFLHQLGYCLSI